MPRIGDGRPPAEPSSPGQKERYQRILRSTSILGAEHGFEGVQMHDVAKRSGVAIATLYRYFPSKIHLFTAVMRWHVSRFDVQRITGRNSDPAIAVGDLLIEMSREMARRPLLSLAMLQANNQARAAGIEESVVNDINFQSIILQVGFTDRPTEEDDRRARLIVHCWYGVLTSLLNRRLDIDQAEQDIRAACELIVDPGAARVRERHDLCSH